MDGNADQQSGAEDDPQAPHDIEDEERMVEARAETMISHPNDRNNNTTARPNEQAQMGVTMDGVEGFHVQDESARLVQDRFRKFLDTFAEEVQDEQVVYPYAEQAEALASPSTSLNFTSTLWVDYQHIMRADEELAEAIQSDYHRFEPSLREAATNFCAAAQTDETVDATSRFFLAFYNTGNCRAIRQLHMEQIGHLIQIRGTVTRTSEVRPELLVGTFRCQECGFLSGQIPQQFHYTRPVMCRNPRCKQAGNKFQLETEASEFCDWQKLRVQETSDEIPPGSMPRTVDVYVRHEMVERCKAGDTVDIIGAWVVIPDGSALARAGEATRQRQRGPVGGGGGGVRGLKNLGVRELTYRTALLASAVLTTSIGRSGLASILYAPTTEAAAQTPEQVVAAWSPEERQEIRDMQQSPRLYEQLAASLCPNTFGHTVIKKGLVLLLLGGVHKTAAAGTKLRGDINVLIVGDPSTAKSQFLKCIHSLHDNCVYTAGKASSAAGLTAAVQRDSETGEYCIEAGALMLADNGICCIDEFDKMDLNDQVAIHEAMEQQTITITKAGIQASLNARASVLAAANPIHGRYDRTKTLKANVNLSPPILSRFDLFFVVLDDCNPDSDLQVATHILNIHRCRETVQAPVPFTKDQLRRYIQFARTFQPRLTQASQAVLVDCYQRLRQSNARSAYRITVRQLESMIRLSEAMARLHCDAEVQPAYVEEAYRLLKTSIIQVETGDVTIEEEEDDGEEGPDDGGDAEMTEAGGAKQAAEQHAGEYQAPPAEADDRPSPEDEDEGAAPKSKPKSKKTTKMTFEEYTFMANSIAKHLRSLEETTEDSQPTYLQWSEVVNWYLEHHGSEERKKVNLVIRRLLNAEGVLVAVGPSPQNKKEEPGTRLAVHPNYDIQ